MDEQQADVNQAALENTPQPVEAPANDTMMKIDGVKPSSGPTLRERLAATFGPARERLGPAFGRARGWLSTGNWIYVLITLLVIAALILPPISLPSRLGWVGFERVNAANAYSHPDGLLIGLDASGGNRPALAGTAGDVQGSIRINVTSVPRQIFIEGSAGDDLVAARDAIPPILELKSPYYQIESRSHDGELVRLEVAIPNEAEPWTTLDLYTWTGEAWEWVGGELDWSKEALVAYVADIPTSLAVMQTSPVVPAIETVTTASLPAGPAAQHLTHILIPGLFLGTDGILLGSAPAAAEGAPATLLLIRNWQEGQPASLAPTSDVLTDPDIQAAHIAIILDAATRARTAGIAIDYQGIAADQMDAFTAFVSALAGALHAQNMRLEVFLPTPAQLGDGAWDTAGYNWTALGFAADAVLMRLPDDPAAYVSRGAVESLLHWATAQVNRYKLRAVVSSLSVDSSPAGIEYVSLESALAPFGQVHMPADADPEPGDEVTFTLAGQVTSIQQDSAAATYAITYQDEGQAMHTTWLGTPSFLARKLDWALAYHLNGVVIENVLDDGNMAGIEEAIAGYRAAASLPQPTELNVIWTVAGPATAEQTVTLTQPDFSWTVPSTPGTYTVAVAIAGVNHGSVALNVANSNPTPTPTPSPTPAPQAEVEVEAGCLRASFVSDVTVPDGTHFDKGEAFTKTWRVRNSGTCDWPEGTVLVLNYSDFGGPETTTVGAVAVGETVDISIDLTAPDSNGNFDALWNLKVDGAEIPGGALTAVIQAGEIPSGPAVNVPTTIVPVASGSFELGGHVRDTGMPYADLMHYAGMSWVKTQVHYGQDVSSLVAAAHARGFKIQLSALGSPGMVTQPGFEQNFAAWVAQMAATGADAIEVWNEPNIGREWQEGYISPQAYTNLLCASYSAIKAANSGTAVISAAPAPTGWFGGCGPNGCDDQPFLEGVAAAGGAACMDYIGAHHNAGATSPSASSGHPADGGGGHHSWYFLPQTRLYYNIFGGSRQLFYTEMGYASQEGLPTFSDAFAWARGINNSMQSNWLAEAVSLSVNTGMVRCIIVWNIDYVRYGDDPQDGYAIVRSGNACPACDTLHAVLGTR